MQLPIHLPGEQLIYYKPGEDASKLHEQSRKTKLTAWFNLNCTSEVARSLLYTEIQEHFTWNSSLKIWQPRRNVKKIIERMINVAPKAQEFFYLRILLPRLRGPSSFKDLLSIIGVMYRTFREVCFKRGFLEDDCSMCSTLTNTLKVHELVVDFIIHAAVSNVENFYESVKDALIEHDCVLRKNKPFPDSIHSYFKQERFETYEANYNDYNLPPVPIVSMDLIESQRQDPDLFGADDKPLNFEQKKFFDELTHTKCGIFFLDGPGGCGKTYLLTTICSFTGTQSVGMCK